MIFSGNESKLLWKDINKVYKQKKKKKIARIAGLAIYNLGCRCQDLEEVVFKQKAAIQNLSTLVDQLRIQLEGKKAN